MRNIKHIRHIAIRVGILAVWVFSGCASEDIALINEVKRFEPQWMNLSEKAAFVQEKLSITRRRYPNDLETVDPYIQKTNGDTRNTVYGLRSQYDKVMSDRERIAQRFEIEMKRLEEAVYDFNEWENQLMKKEVKQAQAREKFEEFKRLHSDLQREMQALENDVIKNIQEHNAIMRQFVQVLALYNNFDIAMR